MRLSIDPPRPEQGARLRAAVLVVNPHCRHGGGDLTPLIERLRAHGIVAQPCRPRSRDEAAARVRAARGQADLVIVGGGDGTLSGLIEPVLETGLPLGVLPLGTANDLARTLGLPMDPVEAVDAIAVGNCHRIDLGRVNGCYFFNAASIGLGVAVNSRLTHEVKGRWGVLGYAHSLMCALQGSRAFSARLICDGEVHRLRSVQITVGNGRHYGGGMTVHADAAIDDQTLDVYSIPPRRPWELVRLLPVLRRGPRHRDEAVFVRRGRRIELRTGTPLEVTADGEPVSRTPALFEVVPAALPVLVASIEAKGLSHVAQ